MAPDTDIPYRSPTVHIPPELIPSILQYVAPTHSFPSLLPQEAFADGSLWQQYRYDLRAFTQFTLVCRTWRTFSREIMFHTLVVSWFDESILRLHLALRQFGPLSRVMLIFSTDASSTMGTLSRSDFCAALEGCFRSMPQITKVEFHGILEKIFCHTASVEAGHFELLSVRSLTLGGSVGHSGKFLLHALARAAASLETLEMMYFENWPSGYQLPAPLGKLRSLILRRTYLSIQGIIDLLSGHGQDGNRRMALRKLVIIPSHLQTIPPDVTPLLMFGSIGDHLRFLMIHKLDPFQSLACCPALETFIYISPTSSNIFPFLPRTLRRLAISEVLLSPTDRFVAYITSENAQNLVRLAVTLTHDTSSALTAAIEPFTSVTETCKNVGVSLTYIVPGKLKLSLEGWDDAAELFQTVQSLPKARLRLT